MRIWKPFSLLPGPLLRPRPLCHFHTPIPLITSPRWGPEKWCNKNRIIDMVATFCYMVTKKLAAICICYIPLCIHKAINTLPEGLLCIMGLRRVMISIGAWNSMREWERDIYMSYPGRAESATSMMTKNISRKRPYRSPVIGKEQALELYIAIWCNKESLSCLAVCAWLCAHYCLAHCNNRSGL